MYKRISFVVLSICICLLMSGCRSHRPAVTNNSYEQSTIESSEKTELKPYYVKPDSASILARLACDSLNNVYLKELSTRTTPGTTANVSLKNNVLSVNSVTKHDTLYLPQKTIIHKKSYTKTVTIIKINTITVNVIYWWQKWLMWIGAVSIVTLVLFMGLKWSKIGILVKRKWKLTT